MSGGFLHTIFDVAAWLGAGGAVWWLSRRGLQFPAQSFELPYVVALLFGAGIGAYLFGTLNLYFSGQPGVARSVEGALAGGIVAVELYKWTAGISLRTGARFALPLAVGVATDASAAISPDLTTLLMAHRPPCPGANGRIDPSIVSFVLVGLVVGAGGIVLIQSAIRGRRSWRQAAKNRLSQKRSGALFFHIS